MKERGKKFKQKGTRQTCQEQNLEVEQEQNKKARSR